MTTKPIEVVSERRVSADVDEGCSVGVSGLDERDDVMMQSRPIMNEVSDHRVEWSGGETFEDWIGHAVGLRFTINKGTMYGFEL